MRVEIKLKLLATQDDTTAWGARERERERGAQIGGHTNIDAHKQTAIR